MSLSKSILAGIGTALIGNSAYGATTVFHFSVNDTDAAGLPVVPSVGGSDGTAQDPFTDLLSANIPTSGVPAGAGNRSIVGAGAAGSAGINSASTQELSNSLITAEGGFVMESWFLWNGGGNVNSIIDYAGTEKFRLNGGSGVLDFNFDSGTGAQDIGTITAGVWHYVAVIFEWDGGATNADGGIGGTLSYFLDSTVPLGTATVVKDDFGDGLNRAIGVGRHPVGFVGDDFDGLIYEPRVTLGVLTPGELLNTVPEPSTALFGACASLFLLGRRRRL
ncbi:hypothetical protein V2O64_20040 [Verrucomicrobiaceae bacterium 227]